jgi:peptidoglycan/LPS O-acetylase OafA/YrhL
VQTVSTSPSALSRLLLRFRRVTSGGGYIPEVDGVRCVAILMVIAQHLHERVLRRFSGNHEEVEASWGHHLLSQGGMGVLIFFALSGFILYQLLSRPLLQGQTLNWRAYFWRRVTRLEPPYIVITTGILLFVTVLGYKSGGKLLGKGGEPVLASYAATITYTHTLIFGRPPSYNPPGWSLETEVQFYLLAPLIALALLRLPRPWWRFGATVAIIAAWPTVVHAVTDANFQQRFPTTILTFLPHFLAGVLVCEWIRATSPFSRGWSVAVDLLALVSLAKLTHVLHFHLPLLPGLEEPLLLTLILLAAFRGYAVKALLSQPAVATFGGMCYTIYLVHVPTLELVASGTVRFFPGLGYWSLLGVEALIGVPTVVVVSAVAFLLVEQPCMRKNWPTELRDAIRRRLGAGKSTAGPGHPPSSQVPGR